MTVPCDPEEELRRIDELTQGEEMETIHLR